MLHELALSDEEDIFNSFSERKIYFRENYFEEYDEKDFVRRFRLSKKAALDILIEIEDKLEFTSDRYCTFLIFYIMIKKKH